MRARSYFWFEFRGLIVRQVDLIHSDMVWGVGPCSLLRHAEISRLSLKARGVWLVQIRWLRNESGGATRPAIIAVIRF